MEKLGRNPDLRVVITNCVYICFFFFNFFFCDSKEEGIALLNVRRFINQTYLLISRRDNKNFFAGISGFKQGICLLAESYHGISLKSNTFSQPHIYQQLAI